MAPPSNPLWKGVGRTHPQGTSANYMAGALAMAVTGNYRQKGQGEQVGGVSWWTWGMLTE